ncbi:MAG TPA: Wzz/FepE/Etk N-terminal domain-containing protein, partial [Acetobacteraceae bacterium]|nr:Wzz/FepE/Etk N-terminal domain-containing protein [Acetobacteraceae bacterium]
MDTHMTSLDALEGHRRPAAAAGSGRDGVLNAMVRRLWRGKWLILLCGIVTAGITYAVMSRMPQQYTSEGIVVVETQRIAIPELQGVQTDAVVPDPIPIVRSEMQQLRSRALLREVVDEFNLVTRPEFNPALEGPGLRTRVFAFLRDVLPPSVASWLPPPPTELSEEAKRGVVAEMLARQLATFNDNRSLIITLGLTARDPQVAAEVLNGIMNRYLAGKIEARTSVNREGNAALVARLAELRADVEEADRRVAAQREQYNLVTLRAGSVNQLQLEEMTTALARAASERQQAEAAWERARSRQRPGGQSQDLADVLSSATMSRLREREAEAARRVAELANRFGSSHPDRRAAAAELGAVRTEIESET